MTAVSEALKTVQVLGQPLAALDYDQAVALVSEWAAQKTGVRAVAAANTHLVTLARHDARFAATMEQFDLVLPDGMPLVWCMNRLGASLKDRVYGPTFMLHVLKLVQGTHFFLGGTEELLLLLREQLKERFPHLQIAGAYAPPFGVWNPVEDDRIVETISQSGADYIWIGLGCPKQEQWLARMKSRLPAGVYLAVGAAFAFHAGRVRQAPLLLQRHGLEWFFRLLTEPRRLWKRFFVYNTLFIFYLLKYLLSGR